jgi:hypothetical protein
VASSQSIIPLINKWRDAALDYGIAESEYWTMTIAELIRLIDSRKRIQEIEAKEKATFDYILADLIGRSVARVHSSANHYPSIAEAYPSLFSKEEMEEETQAKKDELSALRFKQFAQAYNNRYKGAANKLNE